LERKLISDIPGLCNQTVQTIGFIAAVLGKSGSDGDLKSPLAIAKSRYL
jgi:hypothetical protein